MHTPVRIVSHFLRLRFSSKRRLVARGAFMTALGICSLSQLRAIDSWADPTTGGTWATSSNWTNHAIPTSSDATFITGTNFIIVTLDGTTGNGNAQSLTLDSAQLELLNNATLQVVQGITLGGASRGALTIESGTTVNAGQLTLQSAASTNGSVDLHGTLDLGSGILTVGTSNVGSTDSFDIFTGSSLTTGGIVVNASGTVIFAQNNSMTISAPVSGTGDLTFDTGVTVFTGDGSGFHGTFSFDGGDADVINAAYLANATLFEFVSSNASGQLEVGTSATTALGSVMDLTNGDGTIDVDIGQTFTHRGTIIDGGADSTLTKTGVGQFILDGDGSGFSGKTVVQNGLFEIDQNHTLGNDSSTSAVVVNSGELRVDPLGSTTVQNVTVNTGGLLTDNGILDSVNTLNVQVLGGTLAGIGTIQTLNHTAQVTVGNGMGIGGTIEPGTPFTPTTAAVPMADIGSMIIYGNLTLNSDATAIFKVAGSTHNAAPVAGTDYDQLEVSGVVQLGGTLVVQAASGVVQPGDHFDFITTFGGFDPAHNTFATVNILNNALSYTQSITNAGLTYELTLTASQNSFVPFAQTPNQAAIASALDTQYANLGNTAIITALDNIPGSALPDALEQMSPQPLQVFSHIAFDNASFNSQQLNSHLANLRDGLTGFDGSQLTVTDASLSAPLSQIKGRLLAWNPASTPGLMSDIANPIFGAADASRDRFSTFIAGNVILADLSHNADLAHQDYTTGTVSVGGDYRIDRHWTLGGMFSYAHTDASLDHIGSKATVDSYSPAIYASYVNDGWYANGLFAYGYNDYSERRNVHFGAAIPGVGVGLIDGSNQADSDGNQFTGNVTGGYEFQHGGWKFGPVASAQYVNLGIDSFQETGPTALSIDRQNAESFRTQLGLEARYAVNVGSIYLTPHASVSWQHEFLDDSRGITSAFNGTGAGSFTVATSSPDRDSAFINVGLNAELTHSVTLFADYTTQAGQADFFAQSVQAGLKISF